MQIFFHNALLLIVLVLFGCTDTTPDSGKSAEAYLAEMPFAYSQFSPSVPRGAGYIILTQLNLACDGLALRFYRNGLGSYYKPITSGTVMDTHGKYLYSWRTNSDGKVTIPFYRNRVVVLVINAWNMQDMRYSRWESELTLGTYDHDQVLPRHGTYYLNDLLSQGKESIQFRGSDNFCY